MKGDFSRIIYDERKHYSSVLMQQGRVQLDSDWNEQALLNWIGMQNMAEDLIGEHGGPRDNLGFDIDRIKDESGNVDQSDFIIRKGRYYIHGSLCENEADAEYTKQDAYPFPESFEIEKDKKYLVYLHTWWRHITSVEDDDIREVALGGPDTTSRIQTIWQVKLIEYEGVIDKKFKSSYEAFRKFMIESGVIKQTTGKLQAQALKPGELDEPCIISQQSRFRGNENQFYRVEIHHSGSACNLGATTTTNVPCATFKWSRENGSVVFPILKISGNKVILEHLGRDDRFGLAVGDWVEVVDDNYELQRRTHALLKVMEVDPDNLKVTLSASPEHDIDLIKHPLLRRWDHAGETLEGTLPVEEGRWINLEDGVQIQFSKILTEDDSPHWYQSGTWWWIPARSATGDVEWPQENGQPLEQGSYDAGDRYAPLALLETDKKKITDLRRKIKKQWE